MRKGEQTRERILELAAELFNTRGYSASSIGDVMQATGLKKGGIYNHFGSKDQLALEAFDFAYRRVSRRFIRALVGRRTSLERLLAIVEVFRSFLENPPFRGGCMLLNAAVESDDSYPALRERARKGMEDWAEFIRQTVRTGQESGELRRGIDPDYIATIIIATLEGAIMMSNLYNDMVYLNRAVDFLSLQIRTQLQR